LHRLYGHQFEYFCAELLRYNGFSHVNVTKGSGDQGVDILATKDHLRYAFQCKCYSTALGNKPVQEITAGCAYYRCDIGIVMTNSSFTAGACALAQATKVQLWDGTVLHKLMKNVPVSVLSSYCSTESSDLDVTYSTVQKKGCVLQLLLFLIIVFFCAGGVFAISTIAMFPEMWPMPTIFFSVGILLLLIRAKAKHNSH